MRTYPCIVVGPPNAEPDDYVEKRVREGDAIILQRAGDVNTIACFHGDRLIGYIPTRRSWVARSIDDGEIHRAVVTGFDRDRGDKLPCIEIEITIRDDGDAEWAAVRSVISELGDELRILAMVGSADGRFDTAEQNFLERYAEGRSAEVGIELDDGEAQHAVRWARRHVPNILDVAGIVSRLSSERPEALEIIWEACALMAEADGQIAPAERQSMTTLRSLLQQGMTRGVASR